VPANAPKDFYDQMHQAVRNSANLFDYSGTEIISGDGEGFHKLNWGSSEIKKQNISALLAAGLTDDEMRSMRFQTQADGAYISLVLYCEANLVKATAACIESLLVNKES